jgi:hypothetical protein
MPYFIGYNWCVDAIKVSSHSSLASDLEINKAVMYLKQKEFSQAVDTLRAFEKKETKVASAAATNLAFIHFLVSYELRKTWFQYSLEIYSSQQLKIDVHHIICWFLS